MDLRAATAKRVRLYDRLGLAEYEVIEGFVRWDVAQDWVHWESLRPII